MNVIKKLSTQEAQKIAAGEVVERPAHILKELIENALDAQSTRIAITLVDGGKTLLRVTDNGFGMTKEDAFLCFERYATSKITKLDDLQAITTYGFRGEALASICAVAEVDLVTQKADASHGILLNFLHGTLVETHPIGASVGTSITVKNLFDNLPARKKFLKTTATEWNQCATLFKAYAASNLSVHWSLEHDGVMLYNCPQVVSGLDRAVQLFDANLANHLLLLESVEHHGMSIQGIITQSSYGRYDRNALYFFVNGRWVKNYQLAGALIKAYGNTLPTGRYPAAVIMLSIDPQDVDINVHPKKEEVLFLHPKRVLGLIAQAVQKTFEMHLSQNLNSHVSSENYSYAHQEFSSLDFKEVPTLYSKKSWQVFNNSHHDSYAQILPINQSAEKVVHAIAPQEAQEEETLSYLDESALGVQQQAVLKEYTNLIGQYNKTYLLLEHAQGLLLVDQHAAHERILYEQFSVRFDTVSKINLLFPEIISFPQEELKLLEPCFQLLSTQGIEIEKFSENSCMVRSTPVFFKNQSVRELLLELLSWLKEYEGLMAQELFKRLTEKLRAQMACKAAIKAGDDLPREQQEKLLYDLQNINNRFTCPHGRPTSWLILLCDIEKKFKRRA